MRKALQDDGLPTADDFVDVMHPSAAGAAAVAAAAADTLRAAGWPEARLLARDTPFDASSLVDDRRFASGGQPPQYSPQAQLFDLSLPARTPGDGDPGAREPATPGDPPAPPTPPR
jgi:hypothetical protein